MTIKLFDTSAQKRFEEDVEAYEERMEKLRDGPMGPSTVFPTYPKRPEPIANSVDPGLEDHQNSYAVPASLNGDNYPKTDCVELDGTMQSSVKGFESRWSTEESAVPFKKG